MRKVIECNGKYYRVETFSIGNSYRIEIYEVDESGEAKDWLPVWAQRYNMYDNMIRGYNDIVNNLWEYVG